MLQTQQCRPWRHNSISFNIAPFLMELVSSWEGQAWIKPLGLC